MGSGIARGEERAILAAQEAINSHYSKQEY